MCVCLWERISDALYLIHIFIYISSFRPRHITVVNLCRTRGQSWQVAFGVLLKSGEKDAWKSVWIQSLQCDLALSWLPAIAVWAPVC